jgi:hypothetical protein
MISPLPRWRLQCPVCNANGEAHLVQPHDL